MNKRSITGIIAPLAIAAAILTSTSSVTLAQSGSSSRTAEKLAPPTPGQAKTDGIVWPMLLGIVVAGAALVVNLIPSKRGHQD